MKRPLIYLLALLISSCGLTNVSLYKVNEDGYYYFKNNSVSVLAPKIYLADMHVHDTDNSVVFVTGNGYWQAGGQYEIDVYEKSKVLKNDDNFIKKTRASFKSYLIEPPLGFNLELLEEKILKINNKEAYQSIYIDESKATVVVTSIKLDRYIVVATVIYRVYGNNPPDEQVPWPIINDFLDKISETRKST